jgi:hypothetical protein
MTTMRTTLLGDGSSDRTLIPILQWLLQCKVTRHALSATQWVDFGFRRGRQPDFAGKIRFAIDNYPCDLLFVHRDAEGQNPADRRTEILNAVRLSEIEPPAVCVVPVRMTEAWLLVDEAAIRTAAGNPRGRLPLNLPAPRFVEQQADPKELLFESLRVASEQAGRRLRDLGVEKRRHRVAELMDWALLHEVPAFQSLDAELSEILDSRGWS